MQLRRIIRRVVPYELRLRVALARRWCRDRLRQVDFAQARGKRSDFPHVICCYARKFVDYPGQEAFALAKRRNQSLLANQLDGVVIGPGETFSIWHLADRPHGRHGYLPAAALKAGHLTSETGGAICLLSTVLYNIALLGALEIEERYCHSVDSYGPRRYFELARDAAIEYGYRDLRFRNPHPFPVLVDIDVTSERVEARLCAEKPVDLAVSIEVDEPRALAAGWHVTIDKALPPLAQRVAREPLNGLSVTARRVIEQGSNEPRVEPMPPTTHEPVPGELVLGRATRLPGASA